MFFLGMALILAAVAILVLYRLGRNLPRTVSVLSWLTILVTVLWFAATAHTLFSGRPVRVTVPLTGPAIELPTEVDAIDPDATLESGSFSEATASVTGLSTSTLVLMLLGALAGAATLIGVCLVVDRLARSLSEFDPFSVGGAALQRTAWIVLFGGFTCSVLNQIASFSAGQDVFRISGWGVSGSGADDITDLSELGWPDASSFNITIPLWPIGAALVLALLASVFRYGAQLRRDSAGLV